MLNKTLEVAYELPFPGKVLPDSPFWVFKVIRDKVWYGLSFSHLKKAELALLFSDKRLGSAKILFEKPPEPREHFEIQRRVCDKRRLKKLIGFECKTTLSQGLKKLMQEQ